MLGVTLDAQADLHILYCSDAIFNFLARLPNRVSRNNVDCYCNGELMTLHTD